MGSSLRASTPTRTPALRSAVFDSGRCTRLTVRSGPAPSDRAVAVMSSETCSVPDSIAASPGVRKRTAYAYSSTSIDPVATAPGRFEADLFESGVDGDDREQHADADDGPGNRVSECRGPRGELGHSRSAEPACVGEQRREEQADERGDGDELQAVPQVPGELVEQRRAAWAALFGDRPQEQLQGGSDEGDEDHERARGRGRGRPPPGQPGRGHSAVRPAGLAEPGAPAADAFEPDREHGEREHDERESRWPRRGRRFLARSGTRRPTRCRRRSTARSRSR